MGTCGDVGLVGLVSPCPVLARAGGQLLRINHRDPDSCGVVDLGGAGVCGSGRVAEPPTPWRLRCCRVVRVKRAGRRHRLLEPS